MWTCTCMEKTFIYFKLRTEGTLVPGFPRWRAGRNAHGFQPEPPPAANNIRNRIRIRIIIIIIINNNSNDTDSDNRSTKPRCQQQFHKSEQLDCFCTASFKSPFWPWTLLGQARSWPSRAWRLQQGTEEFPDKFPTLAEKLAHNAAAGVSTLQELALQQSLFVSFDLLLISVLSSYHDRTHQDSVPQNLRVCLGRLPLFFVVQKLSVSLQSIFHLQPAHVQTGWPRVSNGQSFGWGS